jgi:hypothetical protein
MRVIYRIVEMIDQRTVHYRSDIHRRSITTMNGKFIVDKGKWSISNAYLQEDISVFTSNKSDQTNLKTFQTLRLIDDHVNMTIKSNWWVCLRLINVWTFLSSSSNCSFTIITKSTKVTQYKFLFIHL